MDHQTDIGLVYPHPEGIGGGDRFQPALDEVVLHLLLALRRQPGMEVVCLSPLVVQELGNLLGVPPGRAVDDGPTLEVGGQVALENVVQVGQLPGLISLNNPELKVGPLRATVYDFEVDLQGFLEVVDDLLLDVGLGGGGETQDGRLAATFTVPMDEAADVPVVRAEVVPPLGEAVGLVQHPRPDQPLLQGAPEGPAPQLFRRD